MSTFFERFKRLNDYTPDDNAKEAGVERLNNLGSIITVLNLAKRQNLTPEQVWKEPAEAMYIVLLVDFEQSEYEKRLRKVHEENEALQRIARK